MKQVAMRHVSLKKSVDFQRTKRLYIPEGRILLCSVDDWPIVNNEEEMMLKEAAVA
jgi:hypothetical protein